MKTIKLWLLSCLVVGILCQRKCTKKADIAFVVDSSSSIWAPNFDTQVHFLADLLGPFEISPTNTQVAAVSYSNIVSPEFKLNTYNNKADVLKAVQNIFQTKGDATITYSALQYMNDRLFSAKNGARKDATKVAVITTDGETNPGGVDPYTAEEGKRETLIQAQRAKDMGVHVFAVGVGDKVNDKELYGIASDPNAVIKVKTYEDLKTNKLQDRLIDLICEDEVVTIPPNQDKCFKHKADIIFAIDESSSIGSDKNFSVELDFVNSLVKSLDVAPDETRIGAIVFSTNSNRFLELRDGNDKTSVVDKIHSLVWGRGDTYMDKAFNDMREGFRPEKGGRPGLVPQIAVLVTDGDTTSPDRTRAAANALKNDGVQIFAIGVEGANRSYLETYATKKSNVFYVKNLFALESITNSVAQELCVSPA